MSPQEPRRLPAMDVAGRLGRLRERLEDASCDALVVTKLENIAYLTGFRGSAAMLAVSRDAALLATDARYKDQAGEQVSEAGVEVEIEVSKPAGQLEAVVRLLAGVRRIGLEARNVSWSEQRRLAESLAPAELVPSIGVVESLRMLKDDGELARIEAACEIADVALAQVKDRLRERPSESEFAAELEYEMRRRGASGPAFETIVASGPNSARPHARPTARAIGEGELVVIDFGATVDGYRSDMTRTLCVGTLEPELAALVDAVFAAERAGVLALHPGVVAGEVDEACRASLAAAGLAEAFLHGTGHGVGLEIHEAPSVGAGSADILAPGTVVTVEPGVYLPGRGGVRIEDTVAIGAAGARVLTRSTKDHTL